MPKKDEQKNIVSRPPVIAIMGHIDHGKSTLLDYIRKTKVVEGEAGGITQHIAAYEVKHVGKDGKEHLITFLDTPGHEAFGAMRERGTRVADIAVLVVSAEDGVKKQTLEALNCIKKDDVPYIVAINKIDKPTANLERTKQSLAENEIYIEGYGGTIPAVPISAKAGTGVSDLLDMMILVADLEDLKGNLSKPAEGIVIESSVDSKKGVTATLVVKNGSMKQGMYVVSDGNSAPVRIMEDFMGKKIKEARFSSPVKIIGWNNPPNVGSPFFAVSSKKEAEEKTSAWKVDVAEKKSVKATSNGQGVENEENPRPIIPIIIKADTAGTIDAIKYEIERLGRSNEKIIPKVVSIGTGPISEADVKLASGKKTLLLGFNSGIDAPAESLAGRIGVEIKMFDVIYGLTEWLEEQFKKLTPKEKVEELTGRAKILKAFSKIKDKQVLGGRVETGAIKKGVQVKIWRRDNVIGNGEIRELQEQKLKVSEISEGREFGMMVESKTEILPGDRIESYQIVEK